MKSFDYIVPASLSDALAQGSRTNCHYKAGGTDLLGLIKDDVLEPASIIHLGKLQELDGIDERPGGGFSIGATTTLDTIANHAGLAGRFPVVTQAASAVASPQLRNVGTLGGNLCQRPRCWYFRRDFDCIRKGGDTCFAFDGENRFHCVIGGDPCWIVHPSDMAVALSALNATVLITGPDGQRPVLIRQFYILPETDPERETILKDGELVTAVQIPGPPPGNRSVFLKTADRAVFDFATVSVAVHADVRSSVINTASVVLGGIAPVPWLEKAVSRALAGVHLEDGTAIQQAADRALVDADPLEQNGYKVELARNLIVRAVRQLID